MPCQQGAREAAPPLLQEQRRSRCAPPSVPRVPPPCLLAGVSKWAGGPVVHIAFGAGQHLAREGQEMHQISLHDRQATSPRMMSRCDFDWAA